MLQYAALETEFSTLCFALANSAGLTTHALLDKTGPRVELALLRRCGAGLGSREDTNINTRAGVCVGRARWCTCPLPAVNCKQQ